MMRRVLQALCLHLLTHCAMASDMVFKPAFTPKISGFNLGLTVMGLLVMAFLGWRSFKRSPHIPGSCQLLEKKHLSHKTIVYIIAHENQRFLLADNQHTMVLHAIDSEKTHAPL